jgi:hypothetical protein
MPISYKHKVILIHIPKTAGTSVCPVLDINYTEDFYTEGNKEIRTKFIPKENYTPEEYTMCIDKNLQHLTLRELKRALKPEIFETYLKISITRNPYDRLLSVYKYRVASGVKTDPTTVEEFAEQAFAMDTVTRNRLYDGHMETQTSFVINDEGNFNTMNKIYRFENLVECFHDMNKLAGKVMFPVLRYNGICKHEKVFSQRLKDMTYEFYKEDFVNFDYKK